MSDNRRWSSSGICRSWTSRDYDFWNVGRRIVEEEQHGEIRAAYGTKLIKNLSEILSPLYGTSYSKRNLDYYRKFYLLFPDAEIVNTRVHNLDWSHIRRVLSVVNPEARLWYLENASRNMWSVRELDRNISTQYFERRLAAQLPVDAKIYLLQKKTHWSTSRIRWLQSLWGSDVIQSILSPN